jgi:hypothetical protein
VLVPEDTLVRRRDSAEVIGTALTRAAQGASHRLIAIELDRQDSTVWDWLCRFRLMAVRIREFFTRWAHVLDPGRPAPAPTGSDCSDALDAIGVLAQMAVRRFGPRPPWHMASALTRGLLLCNTSPNWVQPV